MTTSATVKGLGEPKLERSSLNKQTNKQNSCRGWRWHSPLWDRAALPRSLRGWGRGGGECELFSLWLVHLPLLRSRLPFYQCSSRLEALAEIATCS